MSSNNEDTSGTEESVVDPEFIDAYHSEFTTLGALSRRSGATVAPSYRQAQARLVFFKALYQLVPDTSSSLGTDAARESERIVSENWRALRPDTDAYLEALNELLERLKPGPISSELREIGDQFIEHSRWVHTPEARCMRDAAGVLSRHVAKWQARWNLPDAWIADACYMTLMVFQSYADEGWWFEGPLVLDFESMRARIHDGKQQPAELSRADWAAADSTPDHLAIDIPVYLDHLKYLPQEFEDGGLEDDGEISTFDPRTEDIDHATERLLASLRPRVRARLESIVAGDLKLNGAVSPIRLRSFAAFEWLVRYQVLGESRNAIAKAVGKDRAHVTREVNRAAEMIGLTLRKETGGRPRAMASN